MTDSDIGCLAVVIFIFLCVLTVIGVGWSILLGVTFWMAWGVFLIGVGASTILSGLAFIFLMIISSR